MGKGGGEEEAVSTVWVNDRGRVKLIISAELFGLKHQPDLPSYGIRYCTGPVLYETVLYLLAVEEEDGCSAVEEGGTMGQPSYCYFLALII